MPGKLIFLDWIYDVGRTNVFGPHEQSQLQKEIIEKVREAVERLSFKEREFIQMYWFEGKSLKELSELFGKKEHKLDGLNRRIMKKLKRILSGYVAERFGIVESNKPSCVICSHPKRSEIDRILLAKKPHETFRTIYRKLKEKYGIKISTPQTLIGHIKYHIKSEEHHAG